MKYYLRPGEAEQLEIERRQAKKISKAITGKKTPPTPAVVKKLKEKAMSYYDTCAFPKPQDKKKKKKVNGYKGKADRVCAYAGRPFAERHEIFCGRRLRQKCQWEYENNLIATGVTPEQARELWLKLIGRSYL